MKNRYITIASLALAFGVLSAPCIPMEARTAEEQQRELARKQAEFERKQARKRAEFEIKQAKRIAEYERKQAKRIADAERKQAKKNAEYERKQAKRIAEYERKQSAAARRESQKQTAAARKESQRQAAEARKQAEAARRQAEAARRQAETARINAANARSQAAVAGAQATSVRTKTSKSGKKTYSCSVSKGAMVPKATKKSTYDKRADDILLNFFDTPDPYLDLYISDMDMLYQFSVAGIVRREAYPADSDGVSEVDIYLLSNSPVKVENVSVSSGGNHLECLRFESKSLGGVPGKYLQGLSVLLNERDINRKDVSDIEVNLADGRQVLLLLDSTRFPEGVALTSEVAWGVENYRDGCYVMEPYPTMNDYDGSIYLFGGSAAEIEDPYPVITEVVKAPDYVNGKPVYYTRLPDGYLIIQSEGINNCFPVLVMSTVASDSMLEDMGDDEKLLRMEGNGKVKRLNWLRTDDKTQSRIFSASEMNTMYKLFGGAEGLGIPSKQEMKLNELKLNEKGVRERNSRGGSGSATPPTDPFGD